MCLAVPGRILRVESADAAVPGDRVATVDFNGSEVEASLAMTPEADVGDWILVHAGFSLSVLDEEEARETWDSLRLALDPEGDPVGAAPSEGTDE